MTEEDFFDDEMGVAGGFVVAFLVGFTATTIIAAAVAWNVAALAYDAVQALRRH